MWTATLQISRRPVPTSCTCKRAPRLPATPTGPHSAALASAIQSQKPFAVLLPSTVNGRDYAARVAARLQLGLTGDAVGLEVDGDGRLIQLKPAFGGNVVAPIYSKTLPNMVTVRPGLLEPLGRVPERRVPVIPLRARWSRRIEFACGRPDTRRVSTQRTWTTLGARSPWAWASVGQSTSVSSLLCSPCSRQRSSRRGTSWRPDGCPGNVKWALRAALSPRLSTWHSAFEGLQSHGGHPARGKRWLPSIPTGGHRYFGRRTSGSWPSGRLSFPHWWRRLRRHMPPCDVELLS